MIVIVGIDTFPAAISLNSEVVEAGPIERDKMTTEANLPALFCFGSAFVFFWAWWKLTIAEHEDRQDDDQNRRMMSVYKRCTLICLTGRNRDSENAL